MQLSSDINPMRQILAGIYARYATVTPKGIILPHSTECHKQIGVTIIGYKPARTFYVNRHPLCRSLDAVRSVDRKETCLVCRNKRKCTSQIALDIAYQCIPVRLLLAYTSAKNFVEALKKLSEAGCAYEGAYITLSVIDRGRWGELIFDLGKNLGKQSIDS